MTEQDEIIGMARQAGILVTASLETVSANKSNLKAFAKLVADKAAERERQISYNKGWDDALNLAGMVLAPVKKEQP